MVKLERQRYILFKCIMEDYENLKQDSFLRLIWQSIWKYFGMKGANKIGLWLVNLNFENGFGVLRCSNETKEELITALGFIKEINGKKLIISPIKTSSSIKKIENLKEIIIANQIKEK